MFYFISNEIDSISSEAEKLDLKINIFKAKQTEQLVFDHIIDEREGTQNNIQARNQKA